MITLEQFLRMYGFNSNNGIFIDDDGEIEVTAHGNAVVSIQGLCEELCHEDIYLSNWWYIYKDYQVKCFQIIGGGMYPVELVIWLYGMEDSEDD